MLSTFMSTCWWGEGGLSFQVINWEDKMAKMKSLDLAYCCKILIAVALTCSDQAV